MRKRLLMALAVLPLVGFGGSVKVFLFSPDHSTSNSVLVTGVDPDNFAFPFYNNTFGFVVRNTGVGNSAMSFVTPLAFASSVTNRSSDISHPISFSPSAPNNFTVWESFVSSPQLTSLFNFALSVVSSGYSDAGLYDLGGNSLNHWYNFDYRVVVGNLLSSTNNTYRSLVLSHLSQISSHVVNIDTGVSQLRPVLDDIRDINTSTASNTAELVETSRGLGRSFDNVVTNTAIVASNASTIAEFMPNILTDLDNLHNDASLQSLDVYLGDNTQSWLDFLQWAVDNNYIESTLAASLGQDLQSTDPQRKGRSYSIPDAHRRFFVKNQIKHGVVEAVKLRGRYQSFVTNISNNDAARQGLQNMGAEFNHSVNYQLSSNHAAAMDWREQLRQDLQAWKTSDEHGILNIKKSIDDNFVTRLPSSTNSVPFTSFVTNYVTRVLTNAIDQASADVQSNATANADRQIEDAQQRWNEFKDLATGDGDGLNVKIKFPLWESDAYHVNVRDDGVIEAIRDGVTIVNPELTHISDTWDSFLASYSPTNSLDWEPWFEKWIPFSDVVSNYYAEYNASVPASDIAADFLERGFDSSRYSELPWFERVEVLLAMIAGVDSNSVDVADIEQDMEDQVSAFQNLSTNVVSISGDVVGLFQYVQRFSSSLQNVFGDRASPLTGEYVLLPAGHWIGDTPLTLRINPTIQNLCRLIMQCIWYLGFLVLLWIVVNWTWQKVVAVLRWLWSMFDV